MIEKIEQPPGNRPYVGPNKDIEQSRPAPPKMEPVESVTTLPEVRPRP